MNATYHYRLAHIDGRKVEGKLTFVSRDKGYLTVDRYLDDYKLFDCSFTSNTTCELTLRFHMLSIEPMMDPAIWVTVFASPNWQQLTMLSESGWSGLAFIAENSWSIATLFDTQPKVFA